MGPPPELTLFLQKEGGLADFVETGTFRGDTAAWAAGYYEKVTTIELSPYYHAAALRRFAGGSNVRALRGESSKVLEEIVPALSGPALFWLDAHWSGLDTAGQESECPLLKELEVINRSPGSHVIMVDDARLFCAPPPRPHRADHWPNLAVAVASLQDGARRHVVLFRDVFVAVPRQLKDPLVGWLQDHPTDSGKEGWLKKWWARLGL